MPSLEAHDEAVSTVSMFETLLWELLAKAGEIKSTAAVEPALNKVDFDDVLDRLSNIFQNVEPKGLDGSDDTRKTRQYAIIETAVRAVFSNLIASTPIDSPDFIKVWNLFDILLILDECGDCDPNILLWLTEELLESQTIAGCRKVLQYLESRRQRIITKNMGTKKLVILRACNELLRRLSRAEDTAFCGRVFIFMFQCFPLGDKSSVNLRGEFHTENETTFDQDVPLEEATPEKMDVDTPSEETQPADAGKPKREALKKAEPKILKPTELYTTFWSLQESFSQPKRLFDPPHFLDFKAGMEATLAAFKQAESDQPTATKQVDEGKRKLKRKRDEESNGLDDAYNPKYLTSRDLFELETSDLTFRRYFLVQALIIMDFLLSLTAEGKERLMTTTGKPLNRAVMFAEQLLNEEDTAWVIKVKQSITEHIKTRTSDGAYFLRMVDTILARDRNWVRWKIESCPPIAKKSVTAEAFTEAKEQTRRMAVSKRLRPVPMGSMPLDFMKDGHDDAALDDLKSEDRYALPDLEYYKDSIARDDFNIEMPKDNEEKARAEATKASKTWRALRIASRFQLVNFDKIEDDNKIDVIFKNRGEDDDGTRGDGRTVADLPEDQRPLIVAGPTGSGYEALADMLVERSPSIYQAVVQHTTKPKEEGKVYHYVDSSTFNVMLDGDKFLESREVEGFMYGTSQSSMHKIGDAGKIAVVALNVESVEQARSLGFDARYIFVEPSSVGMLEGRLKESGVVDAEQLSNALEAAKIEIEQAKGEGAGYDKLITTHGDLESTCLALDAFVYGRELGKDDDKGTGPAAEAVEAVEAVEPDSTVGRGETRVEDQSTVDVSMTDAAGNEATRDTES